MKSFFRQDLAIDLGTANTLIYSRNSNEIILDEPSVVAVRSDIESGSRVLAIGTEAKRMLGRTPKNIQAIRPLRDGVVADFSITEKMLSYFVKRARPFRFFPTRTRIIIGAPSGATQVERRAIREASLSAGASKVYLIAEAMASAIGAGLPIDQAGGCMVIDIGGGTADIAVLSLNCLVFSKSVRVGGDRFDEAIIGYVRKRFGTLIGEATAEQIKLAVGTAYAMDDIKTVEVKGRNLAEGLPKSFSINSNDFLEAIQEPLNTIVHETRDALEQTPPELAADVAERGIILTGGGALLPHLDKLLNMETQLPVYVAEDPLTCMVKGAGMALSMLDNDRYCLDLLLED